MRLAGQAKMGYYPTPPELLPLLCKCLQRGGAGLLRILDPCAGEGHALKALSEHLDAITYGIELDRERGITAQRNLYECLIGDCQTAWSAATSPACCCSTLLTTGQPPLTSWTSPNAMNGPSCVTR